MMRILVKFPTRSRPQKAFNALRACMKNQTTKNVIYMISYDRDDASMANANVENALSDLGSSLIILDKGVSVSKIQACNRGLKELKRNWDICLLLSDDMSCIQKGWDKMIIDAMTEKYHDTDGCLWFNDGFTKDRLCTMVIVGKKYFKRFKYLYHPDYRSLWCDNEFTEVAQQLGKITYYENILFKHDHPANIGTPQDELYRVNEGFYHEDEKVYIKRKSVNFDLKPITA